MSETHRAADRPLEVRVESNVMVTMRDGVRLATTILHPANDGEPSAGTLPALLQRTPYGREAPARIEEARFFAERGYVTVVQDCRGRYDSEGGFSKYVDEGPDGYDTVEWVASQPWSNGKVGTYGLSYAAHTQAALACLNPPHLSCMWLDCGGFSSAFRTGCRNGGAFELRQVTWAFREALESPEARDDPVKRAALEAQDIHDWFLRMPWKRGHNPLQWTPDYEEYLLEIWGREALDEYWRQCGLCAEAFYSRMSDVPQVHLGGWYDTYSLSTTANFAALSGMKQGPVSLIMGPWTHGARSVSYSGNADFGEAAPVDGNLGVDYNHLRLRFFDHWLKGESNGWDTEPRVRYFVMGGGSGRRNSGGNSRSNSGGNSHGMLDHGGQWHAAEQWPPADAQVTAFYLRAGGRLSPEAPPQAPMDPSGCSRYVFDPSCPVPTIGGNLSSGLPIMEPGGFDQRESPEFFGSKPPYLPLASRPDVLVFQTEELAQDVVVTGPVSARLWVSSSAVDTDFTAKLVDVYPPSGDYPQGYALNLTDGVLRAKFRNSWERPELLEPGKGYAIDVELYPASNRFVRGHRIRLDVSSSNFPRLDVNGNTGENPAVSQVRATAENTVYHNSEHSSRLLLPVVTAK